MLLELLGSEPEPWKPCRSSMSQFNRRVIVESKEGRLRRTGFQRYPFPSIHLLDLYMRGLSTRQEVHKSSPSKVCVFLSLSELCEISFQETSSLFGTKFQPFFFLAIWDFWGKFQFLGEHCFQWCDNQRKGHECLFSIYSFLNWGLDSVVQCLSCKQEAWSLDPQNPYKC